MLPTRLWELLAGATLACAEQEGLLPELKKSARRIVGAAALAVVIVCLLYARKELGLWNVAIVLGTVGLLYTRDSYTAFVLSRKLFVAIGKISYSLYLWHWPFLVFTVLYLPPDAISGGLRTQHKIPLLLLTLVCACISWKYIEQPMRKPGIGWKRIGFRLAPAGALLCAAGLSGLLMPQTPAFQTPGHLARLPASVARTAYENSESDFSILHNRSFDEQFDFVVIGDSHAGTVQKILFEFADKHGLQCGVLTSMFFHPEIQRVAEGFSRARLVSEFIEKRG